MKDEELHLVSASFVVVALFKKNEKEEEAYVGEIVTAEKGGKVCVYPFLGKVPRI